MAFQDLLACRCTEPRSHPGSSALRLAAASAVLTYDTPTFMVTERTWVVSKVTHAPHAVVYKPEQVDDPWCERPWAQVPWLSNGRLNSATK